MVSETEIVFRLILSGIFGGFIGLERESLNKSAGFRTHILVCVGSTLIMLVSLGMFNAAGGKIQADPGRIAAQVISGIGFLGAGTIMREGATVKGLTTAASLWVVAAVGLAIGVGYYFAASIATGIIFLALIYLGKVEKVMAGQDKFEILLITVDDLPGQLGRIGTFLGEQKINIHNVELRKLRDDHKILIETHIKIPPNVELDEVMYRLSELPGVHQVEHID